MRYKTLQEFLYALIFGMATQACQHRLKREPKPSPFRGRAFDRRIGGAAVKPYRDFRDPFAPARSLVSRHAFALRSVVEPERDLHH
jgi:hypothetical protein